MERFDTCEAMTAWSLGQRSEGARVGLVPTMGFLHKGHQALMDALRPKVDRLIVSIFVNPLQFGPEEDFEQYPQDMLSDQRICNEAGVDAIFSPTEFYPKGFSTSVSVHDLTAGLCGEARPGHFEGVATVVTRLFGVCACDIAAFGEKDYQQLRVIGQMARDLALPVEILGVPLVRDEDGIALSSRNSYLSPSERVRARTLHQALFKMQDAFQDGERDVEALLAKGHSVIDADRVDYLQIVDGVNLGPIGKITEPARAVAAAFYGHVRLIDNVCIGGEVEWT
jgi:pantoate--beta-alanine ligase